MPTKNSKIKSETEKAKDSVSQTKSSSSSNNPRKILKNGRSGQNAPKSAPNVSLEHDKAVKPSVLEQIGGHSWTGKLPVTLLSEHCQKHKWCKPDYKVHQTRDGFCASVTLKRIDAKTQESSVLPPIRWPSELQTQYQSTSAVEARHYVATLALFRVCNMSNMHLMLPPRHQTLWKNELRAIKLKHEQEGKAWLYESDPFIAQKRHLDGLQRQSVRAEEQSKARKQTPSKNAISAEHNVNSEQQLVSSQKCPHSVSLEMANKTRARVEKVIRSNSPWDDGPSNLDKEQQTALEDEVTGLGFQRYHVAEAMSYCTKKNSIIEWLLIHVPEDDQPAWAIPPDYRIGVSFAHPDPQFVASLQRLTKTGYNVDLCRDALRHHEGDEIRALEELQDKLLPHSFSKCIPSLLEAEIRSFTTWQSEMESLCASWGDDFKLLHPTGCEFTVTNAVLKTPVHFRIFPSSNYPHHPPILMLIADDLSTHIRTAIIRKCLSKICEKWIGECMIYLLWDWLEDCIQTIIADPGPLIAAAKSQEPYRRMKEQRTASSVQTTRGQEGRLQRSKFSDMEIFAKWQNRQSSEAQKTILRGREALPAWKYKDRIVDLINDHQITIICGQTGSGKSTQAIQFVLDDLIQRQLGSTASLICTQPRRIAAMGLADRVAYERCGRVGYEVGYAIKGEAKQTPGHTRITFMTIGVLLRMFQSPEFRSQRSENVLDKVTHVFVDEVHERSLDTDVLLALLKKFVREKSRIKIILMSATIDISGFTQYFGDDAGVLEMEGRSFPVEDCYLDELLPQIGYSDSPLGKTHNQGSALSRHNTHSQDRVHNDLIVAALNHIHERLFDPTGAVLVFLPGTFEIYDLIKRLANNTSFYALPLHASLTPDEQKRVFGAAPNARRKIIVATNIAETSITIDDVVAVVDSGRVKETIFDHDRNVTRIEDRWASLSACKQRRGRAGRVQTGICYKLFTKQQERSMAHFQLPEIKRLPLEQLCLSVKAIGVQNVEEFLSMAIDPPDSASIAAALRALERMAILENDDLTPLGRHIARIPADLRSSKLLVLGATFGALDACLSLAALLTSRSPFTAPKDQQADARRVRSSFAPLQGDIMCDFAAYEEWRGNVFDSRREKDEWLRKHYLSRSILEEIERNKEQYRRAILEAGFVSPDSTKNSRSSTKGVLEDSTFIRALISAAFDPQTACIRLPRKKYAASISGAIEIDPEARSIKYMDQGKDRVFLHPSSTLFDVQVFPENCQYLAYHQKFMTTKTFILGLNPINLFSLLLFSSPLSIFSTEDGMILGNWIKLQGWARIGALVSGLRKLVDKILALRLSEPNIVLGEEEVEVLEVIKHLIHYNGLDC